MLLLGLLLAAAARAEIPIDVKQALASRDYVTAADWLSAHRSDPDAAFELGRLYRLGKGVPKDEREARSLLESAAQGGHVEAQYLLGKLCDRSGDGVQASRWMAMAADAGHRGARSWMAEHRATTASAEDLFTRIRTDRPPPDGPPAADLAATDDAGRTPLLLAVGAGSTAWTAYLLRNGADPDARDSAGATPLHLALAGRHPELAAMLLDAGADPALTTRDGNTALHLAVTGGEAALAARMLSAGADPDVENGAGWTPRMLAKRTDDGALHRLFGVKTSQRDALAGARGHDDALRLAQQAARRGDEQTLKRLLKGDGSTSVAVAELEGVLFEASTAANPEPVGLLIRAGIDVNARDAQGRTPLMLAARAGCLVCVDLLVSGGARAAEVGPQGRTALMLAAREGRLEVANLLVREGAPLDQADELGRNALWWACDARQSQVAMSLVELGVPVQSDAAGTGPLHLAAGNDDRMLVTALVERVGPEAPAGDGNRPLMIAARAGAADAVDALLAAGADLKARNDLGDTALIVAVRAGHLSVSERLLRAGANPNTRNDRFESAASLMAARSEPEWDALLKSSEKGLFGLFGAL